MATIKVLHDVSSHTLTIWLRDPAGERIREEAIDGAILVRNASGRIIGLKILDCDEGARGGVYVETIISLSHQRG